MIRAFEADDGTAKHEEKYLKFILWRVRARGTTKNEEESGGDESIPRRVALD